ncbi:MAG: DUF6056 family protein [[Clostridium] fimetarium]|nr:DUF6056 family protein [Alistipes timonensis]MCM1406658.1 DUF6056 family protein [[Clostridium] fimetarium]
MTTLPRPALRAAAGPLPGFAVALCAGIAWGLMQFLTPLMCDDLAFMAQYLACNDGDPGFSLRALIDSALYNRAHDNFRIANILAPFSTLFSPWREIFPILTGLASAAIVWLSAALAAGKAPGWRATAAIWLLITLFLPMRGGMFLRDFSLNYIYATAIWLASVSWLIRLENAGSREPGSIAGALLLAALAGGWHEGPGLTIIAGMAVYTLIRLATRRGVSPLWLCAIAVYAASIAAFLYCPGMLDRAGREIGTTSPAPLLYKIYDASMPILLAATLAAALLFRGSRRRLASLTSDPVFVVFVVFAVSALAGALLSSVIVPNQRAALWPQLAAIIALASFWKPLSARAPKRLSAVAAGAALALCAIHAAHSLSWQLRFHNEERRVMALYAASPTGAVFADVTMPEVVPMTTLSYPSKLLWTNALHYHQFRFLHPGKPLAVLPGALRDASPDNSERIASDPAVYRSGGALFAPLDGALYSRLGTATAMVVFTDGSEEYRELFTLPYINSRGDTLAYLRPFAIGDREVGTLRQLTLPRAGTDPFRGEPERFREAVASEIKPH